MVAHGFFKNWCIPLLFYFVCVCVWVTDGMGLIATAHMTDLGIWRRHILMLTSNWNVRIQLKTADFSEMSIPLSHATYPRKLILVVIANRTSFFLLLFFLSSFFSNLNLMNQSARVFSVVSWDLWVSLFGNLLRVLRPDRMRYDYALFRNKIINNVEIFRSLIFGKTTLIMSVKFMMILWEYWIL